ncbi:MAG: hypothetical protein M5U28_42885 [Sandaracinaceae bacterium]|nr:hypothetical protein [Sandaracinaceae bacterium]
MTPRQRRMVRAAKKAEPDPSERGGELNIVPFLDIVVNLMLFLLATSAVTMAVAQIEAELPATCGGPDCPRTPPALDLSVTITGRGSWWRGSAAGSLRAAGTPRPRRSSPCRAPAAGTTTTRCAPAPSASTRPTRTSGR